MSLKLKKEDILNTIEDFISNDSSEVFSNLVLSEKGVEARHSHKGSYEITNSNDIELIDESPLHKTYLKHRCEECLAKSCEKPSSFKCAKKFLYGCIEWACDNNRKGLKIKIEK